MCVSVCLFVCAVTPQRSQAVMDLLSLLHSHPESKKLHRFNQRGCGFTSNFTQVVSTTLSVTTDSGRMGCKRYECVYACLCLPAVMSACEECRKNELCLC